MANKTISRCNCQHNELLDFLCLDKVLNDAERKLAQIHLQQCPACQAEYKDLDEFYKVLEKEMRHPVSNAVLELAKQVGKPDTTYGLVLCEPMSSESNSSFRTKVLFTANGKAGKKKLKDFALKAMPKNSIAVRAMTDRTCNKLFLYLWSENETDFEGLELSIKGEAATAVFNPAGISSLPLRKIEDLGDKEISFQVTSTSKSSEKRFDKIKRAIR